MNSEQAKRLAHELTIEYLRANPGYLKDKFNSYLSKNLKFWLMISSGTNAINNIQEAGSYIKKFLDEEGLLWLIM